MDKPSVWSHSHPAVSTGPCGRRTEEATLALVSRAADTGLGGVFYLPVWQIEIEDPVP